MQAVGEFERGVIREEIECELLGEKKRIIQMKINRREPIDEEEIDREIGLLREKKLAEAEGSGESGSCARLNGEQADELQEVYSRIVHMCHPKMHPEQPETHRKLYEKAQEAYHRHDLAALKLIWTMLTTTEKEAGAGQVALTVGLGLSIGEGKGRDYSTDYGLASELYSCFAPLDEEAGIAAEWRRYEEEADKEMQEIQEIREDFPFAAQEMLSSPEEIEAYKAELNQRLYNAQQTRRRMEDEIRVMIQEAAHE